MRVIENGMEGKNRIAKQGRRQEGGRKAVTVGRCGLAKREGESDEEEGKTLS